MANKLRILTANDDAHVAMVAAGEAIGDALLHLVGNYVYDRLAIEVTADPDFSRTYPFAVPGAAGLDADRRGEIITSYRLAGWNLNVIVGTTDQPSSATFAFTRVAFMESMPSHHQRNAGIPKARNLLYGAPTSGLGSGRGDWGLPTTGSLIDPTDPMPYPPTYRDGRGGMDRIRRGGPTDYGDCTPSTTPPTTSPATSTTPTTETISTPSTTPTSSTPSTASAPSTSSPTRRTGRSPQNC